MTNARRRGALVQAIRWTILDGATVTHFNHHDNPHFTRFDDGRVVVDRWTPEILITDQLLAEADPDLMRSDGEFLEINAANGWARYWLSSVGIGGHNVFRLLESSGPFPDDGLVRRR